MKGIEDGGAVYERAALAGLRPSPRMSVSEWSDEYRVLSAVATREAGDWRTERTPYLREIMDALSPDHPCREVVFQKAAQLGATEAGNNWLAYIIAHVPAPTMFVNPTVELAKRASKARLEPMIRDTPELAKRVNPSRGRDSGNTLLLKEFPGGVLLLVGANSAASLRSQPIRFLFLDEVDAYPGDTDGEGDPVILAARGQRSFNENRKTFKVSTPTFAGRSRIERDFLEGDRSYYHVPCPLCGEFQRLVWSGLKWDGDDPKSVRYVCEFCEQDIVEGFKTRMLAGGLWVPEVPELSNTTRSFFLSSLYAPLGFRPWCDIVELFLKGQGRLSGGVVQPDVLRVWTNQDLGETWKESGEAPPWETLYARRELYKPGTCPAGVHLLTAGADVHPDRIEVEVIGWGPKLESWSVAYVVIPGDIEDPAPWDELEAMLATDWPHADGGSMRVRRAAIDCSYATQTVRAWVRSQDANRVMGVRGRANFQLPVGQPIKVEVHAGGKKLRRGVNEWPVGVDVLKGELYGWLGRPAPLHPEEEGYPRGFCHFPQWGDEWFKQLTAEHLVRRLTKRGFPKYEWEKKRPRNEALDCRIYGRAAAALVGIDRWGEEAWRVAKQDAGAAGTGPRRRGRSRVMDKARGRAGTRRRPS